jgi:hypothetical protein
VAILRELIKGELGIAITNAERRIIAAKCIELQERLLERGDYSALLPEDISVYNFVHRSPRLASVRCTAPRGPPQSSETESSAVTNMVFMLDSLLSGRSPGLESTDIQELTAQVLEG